MKNFKLFTIVILLTGFIGIHASNNTEMSLDDRILEWEFDETYENNPAVMTLKGEIEAWKKLPTNARSTTIQNMINAHEHQSLVAFPEVQSCCKSKGLVLQKILTAPTLSEQNDLIVSNAQDCYAWQTIITSHNKNIGKEK